MTNITDKKIRRNRRHARIRAKVSGTEARPRLSIFRSNKFVYAQVINDDAGTTILSVSTKDMKEKMKTRESAILSAKSLAESLKSKNIKTVVFDRGGFVYTGTIKAFADTLREAGIEF